MNRNLRLTAIGLSLFAVALLLAPATFAGTQDFTLVNQTGVEIHNLYVSETTNEDWEEDVLGDKVLPDGARIDIAFHGRSACQWDMLVADDEGNNVTWTGLNLCETSVVVLRCDEEECWAETE